jgi:16S rRNA processing protein RimM
MSPEKADPAPPSPPPNPPPSEGRAIALAAVAGAHGVKGEVRLKLFGESIDSLAAQQTVIIAGAERRLLWVREGGKTAVARIEGISDRCAAEDLRGALVEVERGALPPLEEGEYYHADLIGIPCIDQAGEPLGRVVAVENFGAGDLLEVEDPSGKRALIPFRDGIADLTDGRIVLDRDFLA